MVSPPLGCGDLSSRGPGTPACRTSHPDGKVLPPSPTAWNSFSPRRQGTGDGWRLLRFPYLAPAAKGRRIGLLTFVYRGLWCQFLKRAVPVDPWALPSSGAHGSPAVLSSGPFLWSWCNSQAPMPGQDPAFFASRRKRRSLLQLRK